MDYIINTGLIFIFISTVSIGLKLVGVINYSWWLVTSPLWVVAIIAAFVFWLLSNLHF